MPDSNQANDVASYAAAVRAALAPLPDAERESLLEDLESHLAEVASESDVPLRERLGVPEAYAAELRLAYGAAGDAGKMKRRVLLRDWTSALIRTATGPQAYREMRALLPELRPGWWILRAYLVVLVFAYLLRDGGNLRPIPNPFSSHGLLQILATIAAIVLSVRLGRRGLPVSKAWRGAAVAANVAIVLLALPVLVRMSTDYTYAFSNPDSSNSYLTVDAGYYGSGVTNIYPYSRDGKALKDVLLYDQDGHPLLLSKDGVVTNVPIGADGLPIPNAYPLDERDPSGAPILPPRVALPPWPASSPTPNPGRMNTP
jgi:hypothetical protein